MHDSYFLVLHLVYLKQYPTPRIQFSTSLSCNTILPCSLTYSVIIRIIQNPDVIDVINLSRKLRISALALLTPWPYLSEACLFQGSTFINIYSTFCNHFCSCLDSMLSSFWRFLRYQICSIPCISCFILQISSLIEGIITGRTDEVGKNQQMSRIIKR